MVQERKETKELKNNNKKKDLKKKMLQSSFFLRVNCYKNLKVHSIYLVSQVSPNSAAAAEISTSHLLHTNTRERSESGVNAHTLMHYSPHMFLCEGCLILVL